MGQIGNSTGRLTAARRVQRAAVSRIQPNIRREWISALTMPAAITLTEGGFVGVLADKVFDVPRLVLAVIVAAPTFANLSSLGWARWVHGRRKIPFMVGLQIATLLCAAAMAFVPVSPAGGVWLALLVVVARCLLCGIVTVRATVWRINFPRSVRARLTARLAVTSSVVVAVTSLVWSALLDGDFLSFRWMYASGVLLGSLGVVSFSGIRMHHETMHLREEGLPGGASSRAGMRELLRRDPLYARYLSCQFLMGFGAMMLDPVLVHVISRELQASYLVSIGLVTALPLLVATMAVPLWARWMDRVHIIEFRVWHSRVWVADHLLTAIALLFHLHWLLAISRVVTGIGRGGGMLAWQLGHNDFARRDQATLYMGLHVTLTGLRGLVAPFLGMALYLGWPALRMPFGGILPAFSGVGGGLFLIAATTSLLGGLGFSSLRRHLPARP